MTEIPIGDPVPEWSGLLTDGTRFESSSLAGRPYVLTNFSGSECDSCATDSQLPAFKAAAAAMRDRAAFVLVGNGEGEPGTTVRQMARLGIDVPVVMDWDQTIVQSLAWAAAIGTMVVDADGRLAAAWETFPDQAAIGEVLDRLDGGDSPSP